MLFHRLGCCYTTFGRLFASFGHFHQVLTFIVRNNLVCSYQVLPYRYWQNNLVTFCSEIAMHCRICKRSIFSAEFDDQEVAEGRPGLVRLQGGGPLTEHQNEDGVHPDPGTRGALRQVSLHGPFLIPADV